MQSKCAFFYYILVVNKGKGGRATRFELPDGSGRDNLIRVLLWKPAYDGENQLFRKKEFLFES